MDSPAAMTVRFPDQQPAAAKASMRIRISKHGPPSVLTLEEDHLQAPGAGELLLDQRAIGLNYRDIYERNGAYPVGLPTGLGMEAAGFVAATGPNTDGFSAGDRVAYGLIPHGAYASNRVVPADMVVPLPDDIGFETAAASLLKGMTVEYLLERCYVVERGQWVLFHSISGGVGQLACQWLKVLGANVIGTVGSDDKVMAARELGCDVVVVRDQECVEERVREATDGRGVAVVYDSIGRDTFEMSLGCLQARGTLVSFGNSSGPPPSIDLSDLLRRGSLYVCRPGLDAYISTRDELLYSAERVFEMIRERGLSARIGQTFALKDVREAHEALESGMTCGASVLLA